MIEPCYLIGANYIDAPCGASGFERASVSPVGNHDY